MNHKGGESARGESARRRISQGAKKPGGEMAKGQKSQTPEVLGVGLTLVVACIKNVYHNLIVHTTWGCSIRFSLPPCEVKSDMHLV